MIQLQFLNKLLDTGDASIFLVNNITEDFFSSYKNEFNYIKNHLETYGCVPDKASFLAHFPNFETIVVTEPDSYLLDELYKDRKARFLAEQFTIVRDKVLSGNIDEAAKLYMNGVEELSAKANHIEAVDILQDTQTRLDAYMDKVDNTSAHYVSTGLRELDAIIGGWDRHEELATIVARTNQGKCLAKGTKVLMADGTFKTVENIVVGDKVQSYNRVNTVLALHNGISNGYKIKDSLGDEFTVSANHILTCYKRAENKNHCDLIDITVEDYLKLSAHQKRNLLLYRPSVEYSEKELLLDPYILGVWLGDGHSRDGYITTMDFEIVEALQKFCDLNNFNLSIVDSQCKSKAKVYSIKQTAKSNHSFINYLTTLNVRNNKHIPINYLTASREQRLNLLAGLLDTDGHYCRINNNFEFLQKNKVLFDNFVQLCRSLGFRVTIPKPKVVKGISYYRAAIYGNLTEIPTKIIRKQAIADNKNNPHVSSFTITPVDYVEYYGFMCDGDSRYMMSNFILTHNTWMLLKSVTAAIEQGLRVGIYSGEMSVNKVAYRIDTLIEHISNSALVKGNGKVLMQYQEYLKVLPTLFPGAVCKVITPAMIGGPAGVTTLRAFIEKENLDILFIDQHSLLEDDHHAKNPVERASNISRDLKNLQVMKKIPIISVSQQNRASTENGVGTEHVAQSDRIAQDSTIILFFEQKDTTTDNSLDEYALKIPENNLYSKFIKLSLVKSRDSVNMKDLKYFFDFDKGYFKAIPEPGSPEAQALTDYYDNPTKVTQEYSDYGDNVFNV